MTRCFLSRASRWISSWGGVKLDQLALLDGAHVHFVLERGVEFEGQAAAGPGQIGGEELAGNAVNERGQRFRHGAGDRQRHVSGLGQLRVAFVGDDNTARPHGLRGVQKFPDSGHAAALGCDEEDLRPWPREEKLLVRPLFQLLGDAVDAGEFIGLGGIEQASSQAGAGAENCVAVDFL